MISSVPVVVAALTGLARRAGRAYDALAGELSRSYPRCPGSPPTAGVVHSIDVNPLACTESGQMARLTSEFDCIR